jgi:hypothetical protein
MNNETEHKPVDLNRRRLAKTGLATPIILATLASKNALANPAYRCTISGQLSNNYSPVPADGTDRTSTSSCDLGPSVAELKANMGWPSEALKSTKFNTVFSDVYYKGNNGRLRSIGGGVAATFFEVMTIDSVNANNPPPDLPLGRAAVAAYVGWLTKGADYPLTKAQIQGMFAKAILGQTFDYPGTGSTKANLNRQEIFDYFTFLTGGAAPSITP